MKAIPLLLFGIASAPACAGLDTGNAEVASVEVALSVAPGAPSDATGAQFGIASAVANVRHVELYLPSGASCADLTGLSATEGDYTIVCDGDKIRARGPWRLDLRTRVATPPLPLIPAVVGTYRRIDVRFDKGADDVTLAVSGLVPFRGQSTPYALTLDFDETLRFEGAPITATADAVAQALLTLDPTGWFSALPLTQCADDGDIEIEDGVIILEDGGEACSELENTVRDAIEASGSLDEDDEDDDEVEDP